jgi:hypothetical protein
LFDGLDDTASRGNRISAATNNFTLECWVKLPDLSNQFGFFAFNGNDGNGWGFAMDNGGASGTPGLKLSGLSGAVAWIIIDYTFADTDWHHIVYTRDAGTIKVYVDGSAVTVTGNATAAHGTPNDRFSVGFQYAGGNTPYRYIEATIDEVAVYETALSEAQALAHYEAGT